MAAAIGEMTPVRRESRLFDKEAGFWKAGDRFEATARGGDSIDVSMARLDVDPATVGRIEDVPQSLVARGEDLFLAPAGNVVGAIASPGAAILGVVKEIQERLERGEMIDKSERR